MRISKTFMVEAAHRLPNVEEGHKCGRLHGHSWRIEVALRGPVNPDTGFVLDYALLKAAFQPLYDQLDHNYLNDIEGLENPSSEVLAMWIWKRLIPLLPFEANLIEIKINETCTSECVYQGEHEPDFGVVQD